MKTSALLLLLSLVSCMGQLTFTDPFVSTTDEASTSTKSQGKIVTVSTEKGFSWIVSDALTEPFDFYITLKCVSDGSTTGTGLVKRDSGYPASFTKASQIMPLVGKNLAMNTDIYTFYAPSKPARGLTSNWGISDTYSVGDTVHMSGSSSIVTTSIFFCQY